LTPAYAGGSAFVLLAAVRRQLFDDIMNEDRGVMGIFLIRRGFPETTRFSRNCASFLITRGLPGGNEKRGVSE
jgi:hypothetical protein